MTIEQHGAGDGDPGRRLTPADVQGVTFSRSTMLHPGYSDAEVDQFLDRVGAELARLQAENTALQDEVVALQHRVVSVESRPEPSAQAVGILAAAQQTADQYVAEAEAFSRVMTSEAREQYEEQLRQAREKAGAIIQAAQEAALNTVSPGEAPRAAEPGSPEAEELQRQVVYLQAFGQACRVQLRSYLEALLSDVEAEWGRAHPEGLPQAPLPVPVRQGRAAVAPAPAAADATGGPGAENGAGPERAPNVVSEIAGPPR